MSQGIKSARSERAGRVSGAARERSTHLREVDLGLEERAELEVALAQVEDHHALLGALRRRVDGREAERQAAVHVPGNTGAGVGVAAAAVGAGVVVAVEAVAVAAVSTGVQAGTVGRN
eukprot:5106804-Pleurochrysis_carterae.AAC.1